MADDIWSRYGNSLPMSASPGDRVVGQTEWGAPVYQTTLGAQYYEPLVTEQPRGSVMGGLASAFSNDPFGTIGSGIGSLASGVWDAVSAPARAWRGEPVTNADAFNTAGVAQLGSFGGVAPEGALGANYIRRSRLDDSPMNDGVPFAMFVREGDSPSRGYQIDDLSSYGRHGWATDEVGATMVEDIQRDLIRAFRDEGVSPSYGVTAAALARDANPRDIVNSAGMWDDLDLVQIAWDRVLEPRGISKLQTNDGMLIFDPELAWRYGDE